MDRRADVTRTTRETDIRVSLALDDGDGVSIATGVGFLDHMLEAWARHGHFGLVVEAEGDLHIDQHHTMEDLGLVLGQVVREALGDKAGIQRFGCAYVPMDEALVRVVIDLSGRPTLAYRVAPPSGRAGDVPVRLFREMLQAFVNTSGTTMHVDMIAGAEVHHVFEALFKAFGRALDQAAAPDPRCTGIPSTKGMLE